MNRMKWLVLPALVAVAIGVGCTGDLRELEGEYSVAKKLCEKQKECGGSADVEACTTAKKDDVYGSFGGVRFGSEDKPSGDVFHDCSKAIAEASCGTSVVSIEACASAGIAIREIVGSSTGSDAGIDTGTAEDTRTVDTGSGADSGTNACTPTGTTCSLSPGVTGLRFRCPSGSSLPMCKYIELIGSTRYYCCESAP